MTYSDMTSEEKSRLLAYQQELLAGKERENAELHAKLDRLIESQKKSQEAMTSMTVSMTEMAGELKELRLSNAAKDQEIQTLTELLSRNNQAMFGSKSQKRKASKATKSREKEKAYRKAGLDAARIRLARKSAASLEIVG